MNVFVGTSGYSYPEWKGTFYPAKFPAKQMLGFYGERFRTVEINNTFYRPPTAQLLETWAAQVPADFRFVLKAPQEITHVKRLRDADVTVSAFVEAAGALKVRLGPVLFQLPPNFGKDVPRLRAFLALLPPKCRVAFEFRHASWFADDVFALLRDHGAALCCADADDELEVPFVSTADWGYLRPASRRLHRLGGSRRGCSACGRRTGATPSCSSSTRTPAPARGFANRLLELLAEASTPRKPHGIVSGLEWRGGRAFLVVQASRLHEAPRVN